jgi:hypothetical protein
LLEGTRNLDSGADDLETPLLTIKIVLTLYLMGKPHCGIEQAYNQGIID